VIDKSMLNHAKSVPDKRRDLLSAFIIVSIGIPWYTKCLFYDFLDDISDDFVKDILEEHQSKLTEIEKFNFAWAHSNSLTNAEEDTCDVFMKKFVCNIWSVKSR
jgi:hypothetical protein